MHLVAYLFLFKSTTAQNLLQNGGFELYNTPANWNNWGGGFFDTSVFPVQRILLSWDQYNSPDYFISTCPHIYGGEPKNYLGYSIPKNGNAYAGFISFIGNGTEVKEYINQQFTPMLDAGKIYCLNFYVSRADASTGAIKNIGAYFSSSLPNMVSSSYINVIPQIENQNGFITDTTQWVKIQGCFTAQGGEQYITIGNFNSNANTDTLYTGSSFSVSASNPPYYTYYYIDDIYLYDALTTGINEHGKENEIEVYPNPASSVISIKLADGSVNTEKYSIKIVDVVGREILTEKYKEEIDISHLEKGIYFLSLFQNNSLVGTKKVVKE